jgi:hypothetical protein
MRTVVLGQNGMCGGAPGAEPEFEAMQTMRRCVRRSVGVEAASSRPTHKGVLTHGVSRGTLWDWRHARPTVPPLGRATPKRKPTWGGRKVIF